jgi:hypothetical protein
LTSEELRQIEPRSWKTIYDQVHIGERIQLGHAPWLTDRIPDEFKKLVTDRKNAYRQYISRHRLDGDGFLAPSLVNPKTPFIGPPSLQKVREFGY